MIARLKPCYTFSKKNIAVIAVFALLIVLYFVVKTDDFLTVQSEETEQTDFLPEITEGRHYSQEFLCDKNGLCKIRLYLSTFGRKNFSTLTVRLLNEDGDVLNTWDVDCSLLNDKAYQTFALDNKISDSGDKKFYLELTSDAEAGNGVTVGCSTKAEKKGLSLDGRELKQTLCYQLIYKYPLSALWSGMKSFHAAGLLLAALLLMLLLPVIIHLPVQKSFLILWVLISASYIGSGTLFRVPDEEYHFYRAYEVSCGHLLSDVDEETGGGGSSLPLDVDLTLLERDWQSFWDYHALELSDHEVFKTYSNIALYSPVSYIPQASGIFIARHLTDKLVVIAYAGRLANWLCVTALLYLSLTILPAGKSIIALIALMPMNVYEACSMSADGMVVAVSVLMVSFVLYLRHKQKNEMKLWQTAALYVLAFVISQLKIVYLPFCLLYFLIPAERFGSKYKKYIHLTIMAVTAVGANLIWLLLCRKFLVTGGTNASMQLLYVLHNPLDFLITAVRTVGLYGASWANTMVGSLLGELNVDTIGIFVLLYMCLLFHKYVSVKDRFSKKMLPENGLFLFVVFSVVMLIFASLYLQWTPVYNHIIEGIQGRYFIPLLLPCYFVIHNTAGLPEDGQNQTVSALPCGFMICINICSCIAMLFSCLRIYS